MAKLNLWISVKTKLPIWRSIDEPVLVVVKGKYDIFIAYCCKKVNQPFTKFTVENSIWLNPNNDEIIREVEDSDYWLLIPDL